MRCLRNLRPTWEVLAAATLVSACGTSRPAAVTQIGDIVQAEQHLRAAEQEWRGTPYLLGGRSAEGIDCSNFVSLVYEEVFDLEIPHATLELLDHGEPISRRELQTGDLVFFQPTGQARHVGIYLSAGEFAHASTNRGVMISRMEEAYWTRAYWTARRPPTDRAEQAEPAATPRPRPARGRRIGW